MNQAVKIFLCIQKMKKKIFSEKSFFLTKENKYFNENNNKQNINIANNCNESFVYDLKSEYTKKQNTIIADLKTCFTTFF